MLQCRRCKLFRAWCAVNVAFPSLLKYLNRSEKGPLRIRSCMRHFLLLQLLNWPSSKMHRCHLVIHFCKVQQSLQIYTVYKYIYIFIFLGVGEIQNKLTLVSFLSCWYSSLIMCCQMRKLQFWYIKMSNINWSL